MELSQHAAVGVMHALPRVVECPTWSTPCFNADECPRLSAHGARVHVQAVEVLRGAVPQILAWLGLFRRPEPAPGQAGEVDLGAGLGPQGVCIADVADIEEMVWAPRYGLKGMVDASVALRFRPRSGAAAGTQVRPVVFS